MSKKSTVNPSNSNLENWTHKHYRFVHTQANTHTQSCSLCCGVWGHHYVPAPLSEGEGISAVTALSFPVSVLQRRHSESCWLTPTLLLTQSLPTVVNGNDKDSNFNIRANQKLITADDLSCNPELIRATWYKNIHSLCSEEVKQNMELVLCCRAQNTDVIQTSSGYKHSHAVYFPLCMFF